MTRTMLFAAAAAAAFGTAALTPNPALAKIESLGECYDAVITWCNDTHPDHAQECASGGMDECDAEFSNAPQGTTFDRLKALSGPSRVKFQLVGKRPVPFLQPGAGEDSHARR